MQELSFPWSVSLWPLWDLAHAWFNENFMPDSPHLVAFDRGGGKRDNFQSHDTRNTLVGMWPAGKPGRALALLRHSCILAEARMVYTCSSLWEAKRQVCLFIFQPNGFLFLKWHFQALLLWGSQTPLEAANISPSTHLPPTDQCCLLKPTYILSPGETHSLSFVGITKTLVQVRRARLDTILMHSAL